MRLIAFLALLFSELRAEAPDSEVNWFTQDWDLTNGLECVRVITWALEVEVKVLQKGPFGGLNLKGQLTFSSEVGSLSMF